MSVHVKGYSYKRKGKTVKVKSYNRRKALKGGRKRAAPKRKRPTCRRGKSVRCGKGCIKVGRKCHKRR